MTKREFLNQEARALSRFYYASGGDDHTVVHVSRTYTCACGYRTSSSTEIYDHQCEKGTNHDQPNPAR